MGTEQPPSKKRCVQKEKGRVRVTRACDLCKKKKLRCTGTQPCSLCVQGDQDCTYIAEYNRGRVPAIAVVANPNGTTSTHSGQDHSNVGHTSQQQRKGLPLSMLDTIHSGEDRLFRAVDGQVAQNPDPTLDLLQGNMNDILPPTVAQLDQDEPDPQPVTSSRQTPEPAQTDQDGHYLGPASGISFLSRALQKLHEHVSSAPMAQESAIFSFGDAPLPQYDPHFLILPPREDARALVRRYFDFACPTHRFLHQQTIEAWCEDFYSSIIDPKPLDLGAREIRAVLLMVFAQAKQYRSPQDPNPYGEVNSTAYFAASEHHLKSETGGIRLSGIQARLAQCFYLLSQSRVNQAWSLFGTVANLALTMGLHRRRRRDLTSRMDVIDHECRKRVFWSVYCLDSYLSAGLGRPRSFHEEDIDQELPQCVDDDQLTRTKIMTFQTTDQSVMLAAIYHAKLSRIVSSILRDLHGIRRLSTQKQVEMMQMYDNHLMQWREEIRAFLDFPNVEVMRTVYRRQHTVLTLAYSHAVILLHRLALQRNHSPSNMGHDKALQAKLSHSVQRCLEAATAIVTKLRELVEKQQMYSSFWFTHYYVFSALIALFLYVVNNRSRAANVWRPYLDLAQQGLRDLSACATETSYAQRYVVVLTELQIEAIKAVEKDAGQTTTTNNFRPTAGQPTLSFQQAVEDHPIPRAMTPLGPSGTAFLDDSRSRCAAVDHLSQSNSSYPFQYEGLNDTEVLSDPPNLLNWEDFDSLAMEGLADLEFLFSSGDIELESFQPGATDVQASSVY